MVFALLFCFVLGGGISMDLHLHSVLLLRLRHHLPFRRIPRLALTLPRRSLLLLPTTIGTAEWDILDIIALSHSHILLLCP